MTFFNYSQVGMVSTLAGGYRGHGSRYCDDGNGMGVGYAGTFKRLARNGLAITPQGDAALVIDDECYNVRMIQLTWPFRVSTLAGAPSWNPYYNAGQLRDYYSDSSHYLYGYADGYGTAARFSQNMRGLAILPNGQDVLLFSCNRLRTIDLRTTKVSTLAGANHPETPGHDNCQNYTSGFADGVGTEARFNDPHGIAVTPDGTQAFVTDYGNNAIRQVVLATGAVTTLALVDNLGAAFALSQPVAMAITIDGAKLLTTDRSNSTEYNQIRQIDIATGVVTILAGAYDESLPYQDGVGMAATFKYVTSIATTPNGQYAIIGESASCSSSSCSGTNDGNRIRAMKLCDLPEEGCQRHVTTLAGSESGQQGDVDGLGFSARFYNPVAVAVTPDGSRILVGNENYDIHLKQIDLSGAPPPTPPSLLL